MAVNSDLERSFNLGAPKFFKKGSRLRYGHANDHAHQDSGFRHHLHGQSGTRRRKPATTVQDSEEGTSSTGERDARAGPSSGSDNASFPTMVSPRLSPSFNKSPSHINRSPSFIARLRTVSFPGFPTPFSTVGRRQGGIMKHQNSQEHNGGDDGTRREEWSSESESEDEYLPLPRDGGGGGGGLLDSEEEDEDADLRRGDGVDDGVGGVIGLRVGNMDMGPARNLPVSRPELDNDY